ncbi:tRNA (adenine(58)-N(1))-methyltransferase non-catalytic subunit TRM6 [Strongyloides ratti]|uniref:tRNA (adenine(58)-N(1))-methyltransferase non-catalytic subunit TRM6 n=1 Tax=Strongyloides ratti TaxID=34506 RepID=A0A090LHH7_STRRB|nr:tRNA (adenine(58)-N(1))-methyltransferase non-catalytic subunit TRM6 [Strongyloides ratti]CEF67608.1 tRNA (adenine(58)-N(1))-methyltransferase non-catalytic subunit TRM6 [Strongyloides ratti]
MDKMSENDPNIIKVGSYAIVQKVGGDHIRLQKLNKKQKVLIEKLKFDGESLFGKKYGLFEVIKGKCNEVNVEDLLQKDGTGDLEMRHNDIDNLKNNEQPEDMEKDDLQKNDQQKRQKLTHVEIGQLREQGANAADLVTHLISGNTCFNDRTIHAKDKYVRKKTQRYQDRVLVLKPTIRLITEAYYKRDPDRIGHLRLDQLGHIIALAPVRYGSKVFVFDQVLGLLLSSVIERLGCGGTCVTIHRGSSLQSVPCLDAMDFSEEHLSVLYPLPVQSLLTRESLFEKEIERENASDRSKERRQERIKKEKYILSLLGPTDDKNYNGFFDTLLIATRTVDPIDLLEKVWSSLAYSGTLVLYTPNIQHTITSYKCHPLMMQPVTGGYIVSAIKTKK